jgi:hypothetical protein
LLVSIKHICATCWEVSEFGDAAVGTRVRCPNCHALGVVKPPKNPEPVPSPAPAPPQQQPSAQTAAGQPTPRVAPQAVQAPPPVRAAPWQAAQQTHCIGCGGPLHNSLQCSFCGRVFCSERCAFAHHQVVHQGGAPAGLPGLDAPKRLRADSLGYAAFLAGLFSLVLCFPLGLFAIGLAIGSFARETKHSYATAGVILGGLSVLVWGTLTVLIIASWSSSPSY